MRIGFAGCRRKSSGDVTPPAPRRRPAPHAGQAGGVDREVGAVKGQRGLGALVGVHGLVAEAVTAAAGRKVVQRAPEPVPSEEPVERALRAHAVNDFAGERVRRELGLDERGRVERLLVAGARPGLAAVPAA